MFVVNYAGRLVGPFETADKAADWAEGALVKPGVNQSPWVIQRLMPVEEAQAFETRLQTQMMQVATPHSHGP